MHDSTPVLLYQLVLAVLLRGGARLPSWVRAGIVTACGLVALLTPLLLWIAWSPTVFLLVLGGGGGAILTLLLLVQITPGEHL